MSGRDSAQRARLWLRPPAARRADVEAFTTGIAIPRGLCGDPRDVRVLDAAGRALPLQTQALERWSDGSVRWALLDFQAAVDGDTPLEVAFGGGDSWEHPTPVRARGEGRRVRLTTGPLSLVAGPAADGASFEAEWDGQPLLDALRTGIVVQAAGAASRRVVIDTAEIEANGPLRAAVRLSGHAEGSDLGVSCRLEMFAGLCCLRWHVDLHNPRAAQHPNGFWHLGDPGSIFLECVALRLAPLAAVNHVVCSLTPGGEPQPYAMPFRLHQESSGGAAWRSAVHVTRSGAIEPRYAGYRLTAGDRERTGERASPIVTLAAGARGLSVTSRLFWEVFPKAYGVGTDGILSVDLLPADRQEDHELQGGERFSHDLAVAFDADPLAIEWLRSPSAVIVDPHWWAAAGDVPHLSVAHAHDHPYERLVRAAIEGGESFERKRERIDEYGWRHFGDLYADHENGPAAERAPIVSHYNNQYDGIAGLLTQFFRSGDPRWWSLARDLARHVRDVDIYWTDRDKSAYNGGLFWHTYHYVDAGRASHRSYPQTAGVPGGGPSIEHNYSTGLMLHYLLTGDPGSRDAVLTMARWTRDMDDGSRTVFRYLSGGATGLASATGSFDYHGPGRGPGNAIHTLLNALRLTGDRAWLDAAEDLIRRCIHPADDIAALTLLDAERRWYYTVFLQALGRYLAAKSERGDLDTNWHYARAALLHYARWMAEHEYPYLQKPEILEYPTETWAAQDMRKAEVFDLAAKYAATAEERTRFIERARYFFEQSVTTLHAWTTRTWTRPVVLMLSYGYAHLWHEGHREQPLLPASPTQDFGRPARFEPQKQIAMRRAKQLLIGFGAAFAGGVLYLIAG